MNTNAVARYYDRLTPAERFRLIVAAGARSDKAEQDRLRNAGTRRTFSEPEHVPYAQAFHEIAPMIFIELLEMAASYFDAFRQAEDVQAIEGEAPEEDGDGPEEVPKKEADGEPAEDEGEERTPWERAIDLALARGFVLRTKTEGWKLFCQRWSLPPFASWELLPGFDRLQRALTLTEKAAFTPEWFVNWMNVIRPPDSSEVTEAPLTVEGIADGTEQLFQERVQWWGGKQ
jgi:hypothetical protein